MDINLNLTDEELEFIILFMDIGICASEDFNELDHATWYSKSSFRARAQEIKKELEEVIKYEYIINSMGDQWRLEE